MSDYKKTALVLGAGGFIGPFLKKASGADGITPAWFPISSQRIGGEPELHKMGCINPSFFV